MSDDNEKPNKCKMSQSDSQGHTNLCCCYIVDNDGRYENPCYVPVDGCCYR